MRQYLTAQTVANTLQSELPVALQIDLVNLQNKLTVSECYGSHGCVNLRLYKIKYPQGEELALKMLCAVISMFNAALNVTTDRMSAASIYETATTIYTQHPVENVEDLILCLKMAKQGHFGKIYNRVDTMVILDFWRQYMELKQSDFETSTAITKSQYGPYRTEAETLEIRRAKQKPSQDAAHRAELAAKNMQIKELKNHLAEVINQ